MRKIITLIRARVRNFFDPADGDVHTQNIECLWKRAKKKLRNQSGTSQALFPSYIKEFVWHENYCRTANKKIFSCIIRLIDESYNV